MHFAICANPTQKKQVCPIHIHFAQNSLTNSFDSPCQLCRRYIFRFASSALHQTNRSAVVYSRTRSVFSDAVQLAHYYCTTRSICLFVWFMFLSLPPLSLCSLPLLLASELRIVYYFLFDRKPRNFIIFIDKFGIYPALEFQYQFYFETIREKTFLLSSALVQFHAYNFTLKKNSFRLFFNFFCSLFFCYFFFVTFHSLNIPPTGFVCVCVLFFLSLSLSFSVMFISF